MKYKITSNLPDDLWKERQKKKKKEGTDIFLYCSRCDNFELHKFKKVLRKKYCKNCDTLLIHRPDTVYTQRDESQKGRKWTKYAHEGMDKDQAEAFYKTSIDRSKRAIEGVGGASHYKMVVPDMDVMVKHGYARPAKDPEAKRRMAKENSVKAFEQKKLDPKRSNNRQTMAPKQ